MSEIKNIKINKDWLYHAVNSKVIDKIVLSGGIKSKKKIKEYGGKVRKGNNLCNGNHYISLSKKSDDKGTSYKTYSEGSFALIVDDVDAVKAEQKEFDILWEKISKLPLKKRYSFWKDEYQVKDEIPLDKVVGIKIPSKDYSFWPKTEEEKKQEIERFIKKVEALDVDIPYIDVDEEKQIDQDSIRDYMSKR